MGKKESTVENRVYLFKDLAAAWLASWGDQLSAPDEAVQRRAREALAEIAYMSCVLSDTDGVEAKAVAKLVRKGA